MSIKSVPPASPLGLKPIKAQAVTVNTVPIVRPVDVAVSNRLKCGTNAPKNSPVIVQSGEVSITPVQLTDDQHLFKTPHKPAPHSAIVTPSSSRKRKVSGSSCGTLSPLSSPLEPSLSCPATSSSSSVRSHPYFTSSGRTSNARKPVYASRNCINSCDVDSPSGKSKHRYETSLGQLTKKFISLLREAPDGVSITSVSVKRNSSNDMLSLLPDAEPERSLICSGSSEATYL